MKHRSDDELRCLGNLLFGRAIWATEAAANALADGRTKAATQLLVDYEVANHLQRYLRDWFWNNDAPLALQIAQAALQNWTEADVSYQEDGCNPVWFRKRELEAIIARWALYWLDQRDLESLRYRLPNREQYSWMD